MATPADEGGIGGALRRRPFRKSAPTPYQRPPTALRGAKGGGRGADSGGLISKIVDPASRLIASGASRLFSSVFRKRLTAPSRTSEEVHQSREDASHVACTIPSPEIQNGNRNEDNNTNSSDTGSGGIADLEQLLEQKTFTRVEFDRLAQLLRSRTVETLKTVHDNSNERNQEVVFPAQGGLVSSKVHNTTSVPAGSLTIQKQISQDEAASPAEIAKAYIRPRPLKASPLIGSSKNQDFQGVANLETPSTSKKLDFSVAPRSVIRFSGIPDHPQHGSLTAKPPSRTAIYRMSRSPYFKVGELSKDSYSGQSSQWTPSTMNSGSRKALKRGSLALDGDFESFGPIRRIRQKSNMASPSNDVRSSLSGNSFSSPSTSLFKDVSGGSLLAQKALLLEERRNASTGCHDMENGSFTVNTRPLQSSETSQKLFQQLDRLFPSPKDKSSELKNITRDESPSKLTLDMLHGSALRSMDDIDSSKFFTVRQNEKLDTASACHSLDVGNPHCQKLGVMEENVPSKSAGPGVKLAVDANGVFSPQMPSKDAKRGMISENISASSIAAPELKRPAFQMTAPEDSLEPDDDDESARDLTTPLTTAETSADAKMSTNNSVISKRIVSENPSTSSSQSVHVSDSTLFSKADKKALVQPVVTEKSNGFAFLIPSDSSTQSQPPPTPTMPNPPAVRPDTQKEQMASPTFSFDSKDAKSSIGETDTAGIKVSEGLRSGQTSTTSVSTTSLEGTIMESELKKSEASKSFQNTLSSAVSSSFSPAVSAFGATIPSGFSNGSLHSSSPAFSVHGTAAVAHPEGYGSLFSNNFTTTSSSSSSPSGSTAAAIFSTVPSFQFNSGVSSTAVPVPEQSDKPNAATPLQSSVKAELFGISSSTSRSASALCPSSVSTGSQIVTSITSLSSGSSPSPSITLLNSGTSSNSASSSGSASSNALSSVFPSTGSSVFGFAPSTQSTVSGQSLDTLSTQNSTAATLATTSESASTKLLFGSDSSTSSTSSVFVGNGGPVFGLQPTQPGNGAPQLSQSSASQFGSFSSSPAFSVGNTSSGIFGTSAFGSVTSGDKSLTPSSGFSFSAGAASSGANGSSSFTPAATGSPFGVSPQASTSSAFASTSTSNTSQSPGFPFGLSTSGSSSSAFTFASSSASVFSFGLGSSTGSSSSSTAASTFGNTNPSFGFISSSQGNDQMNEDNMTDDTNQAATPSVPAFGQPANPLAAPSFVFGSPIVPSGAPSVFQFGGSQNPSFSQNPPFSQTPSHFQPPSNADFNPGGSFSLGSGGDKSGRKYVKVKRGDKNRRK